MISIVFIAFFVVLFQFASAEYTKKDKVISLTPANFHDKVIDSDDFFMVEFYAPWCGHCKALEPEYKKAAEALAGIVKLGAVDMDAHQSLGAPYDVKGFPTIKFFGTNKSKPLDYNGARTAAGIVEYVLSQTKSAANGRLGGKGGSSSSSSSDSKKGSGGSGGGSGKVIELTEDNFKELVFGGEDTWYVEFFAPWCGHCKNLAPHWEKAARELGGIVKLGAVDATVHQGLASKYGIRGYPTIKIFKNGKDSPVDYEGGRTSSDIVQHAKNLAGASAKIPPKPVIQLLSEDDFVNTCEKGEGSNICMIGVLPNILDTTATERNGLITVLQELAKKYAAKPFTFAWIEAGAQLDFEQAVGGFSMYPTLVAVNDKKSRYAPLVGAFDVEQIGGFVGRLSTGREPTLPLPNRPKFVDTTKWDGKDAPKQQAYKDDIDIDLSDIIGGK